jgi:PAS domain S-box-containing protein/putative nucleotidyltransferase with HDIG domain
MAGLDDTSEFRIVRKDGEARWLRDYAQPVWDDAESRVVRIYGSVKDITERRKAEEEYRTLFHQMLDGFALHEIICDGNGNPTDYRFLAVNPAFERMTGLKSEEIVGKTIFEVLPGTEPFWIEKYGNVALKGEPAFFESYAKMLDKYYQVSAFRPEPGKFACVFIDISDRKKSEMALKATMDRLRRITGSVIEVIIAAVEARDPYTAGHQRRVGDLARAIAAEMGLPPEEAEGIRIAGVIHDLGKISVPAEILSKPRKLSDMEFALVKEHPQKGYEILKEVDFDWPVADMVRQHHERLDGSGYPQGLEGEEIVPGAKILAVADVVEAMASHRPYRPNLGLEAALEEITSGRGVLYDPEVVDACLRLFNEKQYRLPEP